MRSSSARRSIRAFSTGTTADRACCSATARAPSCWCPRRYRESAPRICTRTGAIATSSAFRAPFAGGEVSGTPFVRMDGPAVFKFAVGVMAEVGAEALKANGVDASAVDWFIPHQANIRIMDASAKKLGVPSERMIATVDRHANTSAASIPLALDEAVRDGRIKAGHRLLLIGVGGGFTWGSVYLDLVKLVEHENRHGVSRTGIAIRRHDGRLRRASGDPGNVRRSLRRARAGSVGAGHGGPGIRSQPDREYPAGDADRRRGGLARLAGGRRRRCLPSLPATASANTARSSPRARSPSRTRCRWCGFARRRCRRRSPPVSVRWRRSWVSMPPRSPPFAGRRAARRSWNPSISTGPSRS